MSQRMYVIISNISLLIPHHTLPTLNDIVIHTPDVRQELTIQPAPAIRADCEASECAEPAKHFKHCSEKVEAGKGWHGEDCVEELFHMMHCVDVSA